ncbi:MAG: hypothetical protein AAB581_02485 [Patescibacteria group bacterium]
MATPDVNARFNALITGRNSEMTIRWQKVQIFFLINSVLLGAVVSTNLPDKLKITASIFWFIVTVIWWLIQWEAQNAVDSWNKRIAVLEEADNQHVRFSFRKPREGFEYKFISTHYLVLLLIELFGAGWVGLFLYYAL